MDVPLDVDTWIGRAVLNQLAVHDRRYTYDYGGVERTTDDLLAACAQLDALAAGDGTELPALDAVLRRDAALEADVEATLETLAERGFVERVGEQQRTGLVFDPSDDAGTTTVWTLTEDGRAQVRALRESYADAVANVVATYVDESDVSADDGLDSLPDDLPEECTGELLETAHSYGILPW